MSAKVRVHAAPATFVSLAAILALAVMGVVLLGGGKAAAVQQVHCGDKITTDTTLDGNLVNCPNFGLKIGADDVTLDLNYHTIDGDGTPAVGCNPRKEFCDVGVLNRGHDGVSVVHGSVRQFNVGVWGLAVSHNRLLGISSLGNECCGLGLNRATRSLVRNSSGSGEGNVGMFLVHSQHIRIRHSSFRDNGDEGIILFGGANNLIKGNSVSRNGGEGGILLHDSNRNVVKRNRASRNSSGIGIVGNRNVIRRNRISRSRGHEGGFGIPLARGDHNLIARNSIRDTQGFAISVGFGLGADNVVRRNRIRGAGELAGRGAGRPQAGVLVDRIGRRTLVVDNVIRGGAEDGVYVHAKARHTVLKRNHALGAKDDGIDVNTKTKLTRNEARRNGDLGIEAVPGVIDGGGNKASGNGDPRQCTNIVCS